MPKFPQCKNEECKALCYQEHMIHGECIPCARKTMRSLKNALRKAGVAIPQLREEKDNDDLE